MSLADLVASDLENLGLWANDGALEATYVPAEQGEAGAGFACYLRLGSDTTAFIMDTPGELANRRLEALGLLTVLRTGIQTAVGIDRDPARGDVVRLVATGVAGTWIVTDTTPNHLGSVSIRLRQETVQALGSASVREVRP